MASTNRRRRQVAREHHVRQQSRREADLLRAAQRRRQTIAVVAAVVSVALVAALVGVLAATVGSDDENAAGETPAASTSDPPRPLDCIWEPAPVEGGDSVPTPPPTPDLTTSTATITLDGLGEVEVTLDGAAAPCAVTSFRHLASIGYFDDTVCHRLVTSDDLKALQCGDPSGSGSGGPGYQFADENLEGATYPQGTVAMANSGPGTNGSQFFIVYGDSRLDPAYTPFGTVTAGLDVVSKVAAAGVAGGGVDGKPAEPAVIGGVVLVPPVASPSTSPTATPTPTAAAS